MIFFSAASRSVPSRRAHQGRRRLAWGGNSFPTLARSLEFMTTSTLAWWLVFAALTCACSKRPAAPPSETRGEIIVDGGDGAQPKDARVAQSPAREDEVCQAARAAERHPIDRPSFARVVLTPTTEDSDQAPWPKGTRVLAKNFPALPAVSQDGKTVALLSVDAEDFTAHPMTTLAFYSVERGGLEMSFLLFDGSPPASGSELAQWRPLNKQALALAQARLDKTTWRSLAEGRHPEHACEGTQWAPLDHEREHRDGWINTRAVRFDAESLDVELTSSSEENPVFSVRVRAKDGRVIMKRLTPSLPLGATCGLWGNALEAYADRSVGILLLHLPAIIGGDSCRRDLAFRGYRVVNLP